MREDGKDMNMEGGADKTGFSRDRKFGPKKMAGTFKKKNCRFCAKGAQEPDYKNYEALKRYITERGKILPARITGTCSRHQRMINSEVKKARALAYLPFDKK